MAHYEEIWRFETARFAIVGEITPEMAFEYDGDDDNREIRGGIESGKYAWFAARVRVVDLGTGDTLGEDHLGGCCYEQPSEIFRGHATITSELRRLSGKNDRKSRMLRKGYRKMLANNAKLDPPVSYCQYGPSMVSAAIREAREHIRRLATISLRETA